MTSPALVPLPPPVEKGIRWITRSGEAELDTGIDFGLLALAGGARFDCDMKSERAIVLLSGEVELRWEGESTVADCATRPLLRNCHNGGSAASGARPEATSADRALRRARAPSDHATSPGTP